MCQTIAAVVLGRFEFSQYIAVMEGHLLPDWHFREGIHVFAMACAGSWLFDLQYIPTVYFVVQCKNMLLNSH